MWRKRTKKLCAERNWKGGCENKKGVCALKKRYRKTFRLPLEERDGTNSIGVKGGASSAQKRGGQSGGTKKLAKRGGTLHR